MARKTQLGPSLLPRRSLATDNELVVSRPKRRAILSTAFNAQKFRLVLDEADATGHDSYACRIFDASDQGFGVSCRAVGRSPGLFHAGAQLTLAASDGKRLRVQIRWIKNDRLGLERLSPDWE